jgi:hypothetical protein
VVTGPSVHPLTVLRTSIDAGRVLIDPASNGSGPEALDSQYAQTMLPEARGGFE